MRHSHTTDAMTFLTLSMWSCQSCSLERPGARFDGMDLQVHVPQHIWWRCYGLWYACIEVSPLNGVGRLRSLVDVMYPALHGTDKIAGLMAYASATPRSFVRYSLADGCTLLLVS